MNTHPKIKWLGEFHNQENERSEEYRNLGDLIHMGQFRRMTKKTQVYSDPGTSERSRLTHSLEVSNIAVQLSRVFRRTLLDHINKNKSSNVIEKSNLELLEKFQLAAAMDDIVMFAALAHDLGHPPFAHAGEAFLRSAVACRYFDSNLQNLRILSELHPFGKKHNHEGFSPVVVDAVMKEKHDSPFCKAVILTDQEKTVVKRISEGTGTYIESADCEDYVERWKEIIQKSKQGHAKKYGNYMVESLEKERIYLRHPATYLMEIADDIAYVGGDIEDALKKDYLSHDALVSECENLDQNGDWRELLAKCERQKHYSKFKSKIVQIMIQRAIENIDLVVRNTTKIDVVQRAMKAMKITGNEPGTINTIDYFQVLPLLLADEAFSGWNGECEFGNLLFFTNGNEKFEDRLHQFKKQVIKERITSARAVVEGDSLGKVVLQVLFNHLVPFGLGTDDKEQKNKEEDRYREAASLRQIKKGDLKNFITLVKGRVGYLPLEYSDIVWEKIGILEASESSDSDPCDDDPCDDDRRQACLEIQNVFVDFIASMEDGYAHQLARELETVTKLNRRAS